MGRLVVVALLSAQAWLLIRQVVTALLGGGIVGVRQGAAWPAGLAAGSLAALGYYIYLRVEAGHDGDLGQERGRAVLWRRAYTYLVALAASVLAFVGGAELIRAGIRVLMTPLSRDVTWHSPGASALAALIVGLPLGWAAWGAANRAASMNPPAETNALSRVLLRHGGIFISTLITLVSLGYLVEQIILRAIGRPAGSVGAPLLGLFDWPWALAYLPVAALTWINFANGARTDELWGGERARTAGIRRTVRYLLAAVTLAAFWYGLTEFARLILQVFLGADSGTGSAAEWVQRFATSAAFLLIGAPAWWGHWWSQQMRLRAQTNEGGWAKQAERASLIRRIYLIGVLVVAAVVVVAAGGFAAVLALNWRAAGGLDEVRAALAGAAAAALVALLWALVHGLTLRSDLRYLAQAKAIQGGEAEALALAAAAPVAATVAGTGAPFGGPVPAIAAAGAGGGAVTPTASRSGVPVAAAAATVAARSSRSSESEGEVSGPSASESREYRREDLQPLVLAAGLAAGSGGRPSYALAVIDGADGALGAHLLVALQAAFPDAVLWPVGLNEAAHRTMLAALAAKEDLVIPEDAFEQVAGILAPSDVLIAGGLDGQVTAELTGALARSNARIILLPPRDARLRWVAAPKWPFERWVENAVIEAANVLGVEEE
jgi:hypothetical protein